jgi:opacity protein-like surface antigen
MKTGIVLAVALAFGAIGMAAAQTPPGATPGATSDATAAATANATADASSAEASAAPDASEIGHATLAWLDLQRSGRAAAPAQPTLGVEASLAYQRYLESFRTKIPASFGSSMDTSYSGNQLHVDYSNSGSQN